MDYICHNAAIREVTSFDFRVGAFYFDAQCILCIANIYLLLLRKSEVAGNVLSALTVLHFLRFSTFISDRFVDV